MFNLAASTDLTENLFDPKNEHHRKVGEERWAYRKHLIEQSFAQNPAEAASLSEELESIAKQQLKALESLAYLQ